MINKKVNITNSEGLWQVSNLVSEMAFRAETINTCGTEIIKPQLINGRINRVAHQF